MDVPDIEDDAKQIKCIELKVCEKMPEIHPEINSGMNFKRDIKEEPTDIKKTWKSENGLEFDDETTCGIGSFTPEWLQAWTTPRCYLVLFSIIGVIQGSYYTYFVGTISTLEKRFAFRSRISGAIMTVDELTPLFFGVFVGYCGGKSHRPRLLAMGMFITSFCCFLTAMPYFLYGSAQHLISSSVKNGTGPNVCDYQSGKEECDEEERPPTMSAVIILLMGSFLKGFGGLAYHTIGLTYLDDNSKKKNSPVYIALTMSLRLLGPTIGFLMSSGFLKLYENPFVDPGFSAEDPRWVGAWWIGFMLQGTLLLIFSAPFLLFPRRLPSIPKFKTTGSGQESFRQNVFGLWMGMKRLWKNPFYVCIVIQTIFYSISGFGYYIMLPKYMENQFRLNSSDASLYSGPPGLISVQVCILIGGILIWKFRPTPWKLIMGILISEGISCLGYLLQMIPSCDRLDMAGSSLEIHGLELVNECNKDCMCTTSVFTPLCGPDGFSMYFSPCHAGCSAVENTSVIEIFENCSCVQTPSGGFEYTRNVSKGYCPDANCWFQALIYICMIPAFQGVTNILRVAHTMILLRSVSLADKSFAIGTCETVLCVFGFVPYPVVYGALVDTACLVWEKSCGKIGNCWLYDTDKFKYILHGMPAALSFGALLCSCWMFFLSSRLKNLYGDEDPIEDVPNKDRDDTRIKNT